MKKPVKIKAWLEKRTKITGFKSLRHEIDMGNLTKDKFEDDIPVTITISITEGHEKEVCEWTRNNDGFWDTDCGHPFEITNDEGLTKNGFKFCHGCGREIKLKEEEK